LSLLPQKFFLGNKSSKDLAVSILATEWPLTAKAMHKEIQRELGRKISYQACHKILKELVGEGKLIAKKEGYELNVEWLEQVQKYTQRVIDAYKSDKKNALAMLTKSNSVSLVFKSAIELGEFLMKEFFNYPGNELKETICHWIHTYAIIGVPEDALQELKKNLAKKQTYILIGNDMPVDKFYAKMFEKQGAHIKLGADVAKTFDLFIVGDHVLQIYWSKEGKKAWDENFSKAIEEYDLDEEVKQMRGEEAHLTNIPVTISKNKVLADQIRKESLKEFEVE